MKKYFKTFALIFIFPIIISSQIKISSLPSNELDSLKRILISTTELRNSYLINDGWKVYHESNPYSKTSINVPAIFEGEDALIFEKKIELTQNQISKNIIKVVFLGINNSAEISINGNNIYNHNGGLSPFEVILPKDILSSDKANIISVKISSKLDSENTIPTKQRFLFAESGYGILRDVYVKLVPQLSISKINFNATLDESANNGKIYFDVQIDNFIPKTKFSQQNNFFVRVGLYSKNGLQTLANNEFAQTIISEENYDARFQIGVANISPWSPSTPNLYLCKISIVKDGIIVDEQTKVISFFSLVSNKDNLKLNGIPFSIKGTTYYLNESTKRDQNIYEKIKEDLTFIKQTGFNTVRFAKAYPHPYALQVCQELGLLSQIEFPLNSIPEDFLTNNDYTLKIAGLEREFISKYSDYSNAFMMGIGSSFLPNSLITENFIAKIALECKKKNILTYASFIGAQTDKIENLDFYGFELFSSPKDVVIENINSALQNLNSNSIFFSEVTYPNYKGNTTGYLIKNSNEAQAKYFQDVINITIENKLSGYVINTLFSYSGVFSSLYSSYTGNTIYKFSVLPPSRNTNTIAYKLLYSKLNNGSKVTIPIGSRKEDNPIFFILLALGLSIMMAVLINTKKKFREDASRALLRSYNFFADIRDHRILSGIHTAILMLIISASASLLVTIILYYYRSDIVFEKLLLTFASRRLINFVNYLAWNPQISFAVLFVVAVLKIGILTLAYKIGSFFIKTKVPISNIHFAIIWAFLPLTLFLPIELILYKVLVMNFSNELILGFILLFLLWMFFRMLKGIYVVFDIPALYIYFYSILVVLIIFGGILLKYQLTHSILFYIGNTIKQAKVLIN